MSSESKFHELAARIQEETAGAVTAIDLAEVEAFIRQIVQAGRIFVTGKGRTGLRMQAFAMRLMHLGLDVHVVGEMTAPRLQAGDLLLIGSASGKTGSLVAFVDKVKTCGAKLASITTNRESVIAQEAEAHVYIPAPALRKQKEDGVTSVLPMGGLYQSALGVVLEVVILQLMDELRINAEEMASRHANLE